jgi:hypothetical protein
MHFSPSQFFSAKWLRVDFFLTEALFYLQAMLIHQAWGQSSPIMGASDIGQVSTVDLG